MGPSAGFECARVKFGWDFRCACGPIRNISRRFPNCARIDANKAIKYAAIAVQAAEMGLKVGRMVLISSPARYEVHARSYASHAGLNVTQTEEMIRVLELMDVNVQRTSIPQIAPRLSQKALFIHSKDDRVVPIGDAIESAMVRRGASLLLFEGLGHRRILRASLVHEAILKFISD